MISLIHRLRRHLLAGETSPSAAADRRAPAPDRHFTSRLLAGGLPTPEGLGGFIGPEPLLRIPFRLLAGDGEVKVVVFSDPPGLLALAVEKPDGSRLSLQDGAYRVAFVRAGATTTCSFSLAGLPAGAPRHGTWQAVLLVDTQRFKEYLISVRQRFPREFERLASRGLFYSVSALAARRPAAASPRPAADPGEPPAAPEPRPALPTAPSRSPWAAVHPAL